MDLVSADLPGELPADFFEVARIARSGDPTWVPEEADRLARRAEATHWWFRSGGVARAWVVPGRGRIAAFCHPDARTDGRDAGFFGWWASIGDPEVDRTLIAEAERFVAGLGHRELIGPVEQTSLYGYRLLDQRSDALGPMIGEPDTPVHMAELLLSEGFEPVHSYNTRLVPSEVLPVIDAAIADGAAAARASGFTAVPLTAERMIDELDAWVAILVEAFGENLAYVGPDRATLASHVREDLAPLLCPEVSMAVVDPDGRLAGGMLAYPHYAPLCAQSRGEAAVRPSTLTYRDHIDELRSFVAPNRPWVVCKTVAFRPDCRSLGLTPLMVHTADQVCIERYDGWFLALSRLDNRTQDFYQPDPEGRRLYSVYGRAIGADTEGAP